MRTLEEAWEWYEHSRRLLRLVERLGDKYWDDALPWQGPMGRDEKLRQIVGPNLVNQSRVALGPLDDLAVLVLFSVFESIVRQSVHDDMLSEGARIQHYLLRSAVSRALDQVDDGSFFSVLETFKSELNAGLVEEVNQVRKYRNWVAHGRKGERPDYVDPKIAYFRLRKFLTELGRRSIPGFQAEDQQESK